MSTSSATKTTDQHQPWPPRPRWYASNAGQGTPGTNPDHLAGGDQVSKILIGKYQATIYPEGNGFTGAISLGFDGQGTRQRIKRKARTKAAVKDKLIQAVKDLETGIETSDAYTVADAVRDWLAKGTKDLGAGTVDGYRILADQHLIPLIGATKLKRLTADDVDDWLEGLTGKLSTRSLQAVHSILRALSGRPRPVTRWAATWPNWSPLPRAGQDGRAGP